MHARLVGFLGRKGDGEPGMKAIWQGYDKLLHYIEAADAMEYKNEYIAEALRLHSKHSHY